MASARTKVPPASSTKKRKGHGPKCTSDRVSIGKSGSCYRVCYQARRKEVDGKWNIRRTHGGDVKNLQWDAHFEKVLPEVHVGKHTTINLQAGKL